MRLPTLDHLHATRRVWAEQEGVQHCPHEQLSDPAPQREVSTGLGQSELLPAEQHGHQETRIDRHLYDRIAEHQKPYLSSVRILNQEVFISLQPTIIKKPLFS